MKKNFKVGDDVTFSVLYSNILTESRQLISGTITGFGSEYAVIKLEGYPVEYFGTDSCKVFTKCLMDTTEYGELEDEIKELEESIQDKQKELESLKSQIIY
jgi:2',3'-cyclic-nucleotide 2'-phosphodiesterase (5'-nucleotidase family)